MFLALLLATGDVLVLKEKAAASGRYVTVLDVVRDEKLGFAAREDLKFVYLGRAPESGERVITGEEILKELRRRGLGGYTVQGEKVAVTVAEAGPRVGEWGREALAFEVKCHLVTSRRMRSDDFAVRISYLEPESVPSGFAVVEVRPRDESDLERAEYMIVLENAQKRRMTAEAIVRVLTMREVAFATRDLGVGRTVTRDDFEIRRVEAEQTDRLVSDVGSLVGARVLAKIPKGQPLTRIDLKLKPAIRRRDLVRARHKYIETKARAAEDGAIGEIVWLEYATTGTRFRGRVVSSEEVEVVEEEKRR
ncbi:MAG: flagellar basal body P-ring formation protein FlgA [Planctomycetes bacterium]|nr:flagellar basal body P-ring formation protein FlgA [Planctomycetota bacterium]